MPSIHDYLRPDLPTAAPFTVSQAPCRAKLDQNEAPEDLPAELKAELLVEIRAAAWNRYPQPRDYIVAKTALAEAVGIEPERLALTVGCDQAIQGAHWLAGGPGRKALVFEPTYPMLAHAAALAGTEVTRAWAEPDYRIDPGLFQGHHLIFLARPNNPTGQALEDVLIHRALQEPALIFVDEAYHDLSGLTVQPWLDRYPNLVIGRSCSKSLLAGMRLGYLLGPPEAVAALERLLTAPYHLAHPQLVLARRYGEILPHVRTAAERVRTERERLRTTLAKAGLRVYPSAANFLMFEVDRPAAIFAGLVEAGVRIRDLTQIPGLDRHLRVTVGAREENGRFLAALMALLTGPLPH